MAIGEAAHFCEVEQEFLDASIAVWREIDRLSAVPGGYRGLHPTTDLRLRERAAWEELRAHIGASSDTPENTPQGQ
jgi:hypothetical protein